MKVSKKLSSAAFKCRGLFWGVFAVGALLFPGHFSAARFIAGLVILLAGQALRFYAAGFIPKYRTETIGAPVLVTWGPFRWVRNPLYAGNFIMGIGWALMMSWTWVAVFAAAFWVLYCLIIIPAEEDFLLGKFGAEYEAFRKKVPPLFPFPRGGAVDRSPDERPFDMKTARAEEIYSIRMNILITAVIAARLYFTL